MSRNFSEVTAVWPSGSPTSSALAIPFGNFAGGVLHFSGDWTDAAIGLEVYMFGQWNRLYDWRAGTTGVSIPSAKADASFQCPPAWFYAQGSDHETRLVSFSGTGSGIPQEDVRTLVLSLKD